MDQRRIVVAGGTGFIGTHIVNKLLQAGYHVVVPTRRRDRAKHVALLPNVEIREGSLTDSRFVDDLVRNTTAVVNLIGVLHGRAGEPAVYGPDFAQAHVEIPKRLADAAVAKGIRRYIQVSALGVTDDGKRSLPSRYLRSKAAGEQSLRQTLGLDWTILRPSVVFGREDKFLNLFASLLAIAPLMTLPKAAAKFQPVWVEDVARAVVECLGRPATIQQNFDLVGPHTYSLRELVQLVGQLTGHQRLLVSLPDLLGFIQTTLIEFAPGPTLMSRDNFASMAIDNVSSKGWPTQALGFEPAALSVIAPTYLKSKGSDPLDELRARARR
jgi:uncharacterized protein YbjT (DUF2867 family)